jgi:hypothetical protein
MFSAEDILSRIKQRPFVSVRIVTTAGSYDVVHPELVLVGRRYLEIGAASSENPETFDSIDRVAILHITALHDLPVPQQKSDNGRH